MEEQLIRHNSPVAESLAQPGARAAWKDDALQSRINEAVDEANGVTAAPVASPQCTCGADRTGPSAEAHDSDCPTTAPVGEPGRTPQQEEFEAARQWCFDNRSNEELGRHIQELQAWKPGSLYTTLAAYANWFSRTDVRIASLKGAADAEEKTHAPPSIVTAEQVKEAYSVLLKFAETAMDPIGFAEWLRADRLAAASPAQRDSSE
jgi:hypothetical protein